jgi:hypothetical protein
MATARNRSERLEEGLDYVTNFLHHRVDPVIAWKLFEHALGPIEPVPTLIERDDDVPAFSVLMDETRILQRAARPNARGADVDPRERVGGRAEIRDLPQQ